MIPININLKVNNLPEGIRVIQGDDWYGSDSVRQGKKILNIEVSNQIKVEINNKND